MNYLKSTVDAVDKQAVIQRNYQYLVQQMFPYVSLSNQANLSHDWIHTDSFGYRIHNSHESAQSVSHIFTGGSVCFGFGASADRFTTPAKFDEIARVKTKNLGIGGGNSTSEFIGAALFRGDCESAVSITGTNTLVNVFLNWPKTSKIELLMPFHQALWETLTSNDLLTNRCLVDPTFDPQNYFKNEKQRSNLNARMRQSLYKRIARAFRSVPDFYSIPTPDSYESIVSVALAFQVENMVRLKNLFSTHLVVIQPFLLSDERRISDEEKLIIERHKSLRRDPMLHALFYDFLPSVYSNYCRRLGCLLSSKSVNNFLYTPPSNIWAYSDLSHLTDAGYSDLAEKIYDYVYRK